MKIRLLTRDGDHVHEAEIPPFLDRPDVLTWGASFFRFSHFDTTDGTVVYKEAFAYTI